MADEVGKIEIQVEFDGAQQASTQLDQVASGLEDVASSGQQATQNFASLAQGGTTLATRVQGVAGAVQGLVGALGSQNRTAGLIASVAGSTAQFASMGALLGPGGAVVGGIAGLAAGLLSVADAHRDARPEIEETTRSIEREGAAALSASDAMREFLSSVTTASRRTGLVDLSNQITSLTDEMYRLRDAGDRLGAEVIAERIRTLQRMEASERANLDEEEGTTDRPNRSSARREDPLRAQGTQGGRGGDEADRIRESGEQAIDARIAILEMMRDNELDWEAERNAAAAEAEQQHQDALLEMAREASEERKRLAVEEFERQQALDEMQLEQREQTIGEMTDLFGQTANALGGAIKSIALGEKSAEEAFKGLAAAFLEMISQYASLKAATEFADAAASFARYDYGGGAAHIGAGLAFTAVAVATGIGAAAITSAPQAPARPEAQTDQSGGRGGDTIVNFNSPVVTAGTRAELGREITTMVGEAASI